MEINTIRSAQLPFFSGRRDSLVNIEIYCITDSSTMVYKISNLWGLYQYYQKYFTDYVYNQSNMLLLFDLCVGVDSNNMGNLTIVDESTIQISGTATTLLKIIDSMNQCEGLRYEMDTKIENIVPKLESNFMSRFIKEHGCCMFRDESNYSVKFRKLS